MCIVHVLREVNHPANLLNRMGLENGEGLEIVEEVVRATDTR